MTASQLLAANLKRIRKRRRLSQRQFAELVGIGRTTLSNAEAGRQSLTLATLDRIADALGVDPRELLSQYREPGR